jgi:hypothetical protein
MLLGMTRGEAGLVLFIFALVYCAQIVPRIGGFLGEKLAGSRNGNGPGNGPPNGKGGGSGAG